MTDWGPVPGKIDFAFLLRTALAVVARRNLLDFGARGKGALTLAGRLTSVAQAVRECHVDAAYLCRLFRRFDQQTPYQHLMRVKMNAAT